MFLLNLWNKILDLWNKLPEKWRYEIKSFGNTVMASSMVELGVQLSSNKELWDPTTLSKGLLLSVGIAVMRSAWKAALTFLVAEWKLRKNP